MRRGVPELQPHLAKAEQIMSKQKRSIRPAKNEKSAAKVAQPNIAPSEILTLRIYPPLGIARVGNAEDPGNSSGDYLIGPEVMGGRSTLPDGTSARYLSDFRTADGRIKRQAARFRVYAHLKNGSVHELTANDGVRIAWRVSVANLKAGWYEFNQAMDLPDGLSQNAKRRNESMPILPGGRSILDITPTPRQIEGRNKSGPEYRLDDGTFWFKPVYLGELRTDNEGRLIFLGGRGLSEPFRKGFNPLTFANNVGWHDDVSDGPVRAKVTFADSTTLEADPAYIVVTPPNYAPGLYGLVTLDDAVRETFQSKAWIPAPTTTSFARDIWPIFDRLTGLQWVNHGLFILHGFGSPLDARSPAVIERLGKASAEEEPWRRAVLSLFRDPNLDGPFDEPKLPQIYGDAYGESVTGPRTYLSVTKSQYAHLERWAAGTFDDDWPGAPSPPDFVSLPADQQIVHLERASLHDCLGGPFHPGIELTWTARLASIWKEACRLNVLETDAPARQDYGDTLTPAVCTGPGGPFEGLAAGALTRFLGVPWQTDGTSCNSAADYEPSTFLSMPTFWGARVPDQVLAVENYDRARALDPKKYATQAQKHFMHRVDWLRDVRGTVYYQRLVNMINEWWQLGMIVSVPNPPGYLPQETRVEQGRHPDQAGSDAKRQLVAAVENLPELPLARAEVLAAILKPEPVRRPPKRTYRQGEI
jgi:hypothetical protein